MKWETIKERVIRREISLESLMLQALISGDLQAQPDAKTASRAEIHRGYISAVKRIVGAFDIRNVGRLREICPEAFPKSLAKGELIAYQANNGNSDWVVEKKQ